jgi:hypothetical protein
MKSSDTLFQRAIARDDPRRFRQSLAMSRGLTVTAGVRPLLPVRCASSK